MTADLLPAENMALTVARAQVGRGENPPLNITTVLVLALDRLAGRSDWTAENVIAAGACLKCRQNPARDAAVPFCARCLDICHEALEFDHCCVICAGPEEARQHGWPAWAAGGAS